MSDFEDEDQLQTKTGPKILDEGIYFGPNDSVDVSLLNVFKSDSKTQTVSYMNDVRIFMQTDGFSGDITTFDGEFTRSILIKKSKTLERFRQAVASKLGRKADVSYYSRNESETMAVFPSPVKEDGKFCINVVVDGKERNVPLNDLKSLGPCKMDALVQCKGVVVGKGGANKYTIKLNIASMRVQSLPADYVFAPVKSYLNKYK